jgi:hypothetical protein
MIQRQLCFPISLSLERAAAEAVTNGKGRKPFLFHAAEVGVIGGKIVSHEGENHFVAAKRIEID